jgi:hypothetical protein
MKRVTDHRVSLVSALVVESAESLQSGPKRVAVLRCADVSTPESISLIGQV